VAKGMIDIIGHSGRALDSNKLVNINHLNTFPVKKIKKGQKSNEEPSFK